MANQKLLEVFLDVKRILCKYDYYVYIPSVNKGTLAPSTVFWRLAALTSIGVRPVRLIPLPCQPPKDGTWGPKEFCASDLRFCKALERSVLDVR